MARPLLLAAGRAAPWARGKSSAVGGALEAALHEPLEEAGAVGALGAAEEEWARARPYAHMPGPPPLPLLGNSWRFLPVVGDYRIAEVDRVVRRLHAQYGRVVRLAGLLGRPDMVFLFHPDDIERVFRSEDAAPHRPSMPSLDYYKHVLRRDFFGEHPGVIAVHGEQWVRFRARVQQVMLQPRTARLYAAAIGHTADAFVRRARELKDSNPEQEAPPDFMNEIHKWSLESIARVALDARLGCLDAAAPPHTQRLIDAVTAFFCLVGELELKVPVWRVFPTPKWRRYVQALDDITQVTSEYIAAALQRWREASAGAGLGQGLRHDSSVLERVLAQNEDPRVACALALDMFLVGIDTTSTAVASVLYQLALHPAVQRRLHAEVARELPPPGSALCADSLERMPFLRAVVKETLRMYPVVIGNGRTVTRDTVIAGYRIPKGTQLVFQHYVISNQERFFREAGRFAPERWLRAGEAGDGGGGGGGECPVGAQRVHPFASLPFGFGRRMCLGRRFADLEIHTVVAKMVQAFQIEWPHAPLTYRVHPMYTPDGPLRFRLRDRAPAHAHAHAHAHAPSHHGPSN